MQEEMTSQSIALSAKTVEVTIDVLKKLFDIYLDNQKKDSYLGKSKKAANQPKVKRGKQSVRQLLGQGQGAENIEINSDNIGLFTSSARRHGVDFAMTKDKGTTPPTHTIFFKGKDTAAITAAFKDFVQREEKKIAKNKGKSVTKELKKLKRGISEKGASLGKDISKDISKHNRGELSR